jgi:hypothetical protein
VAFLEATQDRHGGMVEVLPIHGSVYRDFPGRTASYRERGNDAKALMIGPEDRDDRGDIRTIKPRVVEH